MRKYKQIPRKTKILRKKNFLENIPNLQKRCFERKNQKIWKYSRKEEIPKKIDKNLKNGV